MYEEGVDDVRDGIFSLTFSRVAVVDGLKSYKLALQHTPSRFIPLQRHQSVISLFGPD